MSKTDKELAVELTIATIQMVSERKNADGSSNPKILAQKSIITILDNYYKSLRGLDDGR